MMSNKSSIAAFVTLRFTKHKKISIFCMIFVLFVVFTSLQHTSNVTQNTQEIQHTEEERYLAYLPHSGLSNQRIELANGLLLAHILNRTLIIPPAFLGTVFGWMPRDQLLSRLEWLTTPKDFNELCQRPTESHCIGNGARGRNLSGATGSYESGLAPRSKDPVSSARIDSETAVDRMVGD